MYACFEGLRVKQLRLSHVHKIFNETGPSYLSEHFIKASNVHHHFTKGSTENFVVPSVRGVAATTFNLVQLKIGILYPRMSNKNALSMDSNVLQKRYLRTQLQLMETDTFIYYQ